MAPRGGLGAPGERAARLHVVLGRLRILHECGTDDSIHVAQAWGFLKANPKACFEAGLDFRER